MELVARTSPKARGVDTFLTRTLTGTKIQALADHLAESGFTEKSVSLFGMHKILQIAMHGLLSGRKESQLQESIVGPVAMRVAGIL